jgi:intermediate cleaving peptidase 55
MLVPESAPAQELWEGARSGTTGAYEVFNADETAPIDDFEMYVSKLIARNDYIYYDDPNKKSMFALYFSAPQPKYPMQRILDQNLKPVRSLTSLVARQRAVKSASEIAVMARAGAASSSAIDQCMAMTSELRTENELAKLLEYQFVRHGCEKHAYIPVVASGENALTIHYTRNDDVLKKDQLVFIDAGGKLGGYCADISRGWPVGKLTQPQKDIYSAVLAVNKSVIAKCAPGISLQELHNLSVQHLSQELKNLPGFSGVTQNQIANKLYPHYIGHHLGLDLHDVPTISRHQGLVPGNVVTVEPGLYIPESSQWPKWYHGIGVRVEDNVAITGDGHQILTNAAKEISDIERLTGSS